MEEEKNLKVKIAINSIMSISQICMVIAYWGSMEPLMVAGCSLIAFGTGLTAAVYTTELIDEIKDNK